MVTGTGDSAGDTRLRLSFQLFLACMVFHIVLALFSFIHALTSCLMLYYMPFVWWMFILHTYVMPPHTHMPCFMPFDVLIVFFFHHHDDTTLAHAMLMPFA